MWPFKKKRKPNPRPTEARTAGQPFHVNPDKRAMRGRNEARMARLRAKIAELEAEGKATAGLRAELERREKGLPKQPKPVKG